MREIKDHNLKIGVYEITPEDAAELLSRKRPGFQNRPIKDAQVQAISEDVAAGTFTLNGESLILSENSEKQSIVIDGQHRLKAVIRAGKPMRSVVVSGVPMEVFWSVGDGMRRTLGQILAIYGHKNANVLAATLKMVYWSLKGSSPCSNLPPPRDVCLLHLKDYPEIEGYVAKANIARDIMPPAMCAYLMWVVAQRGTAEMVNTCYEFFYGVGTGAGLDAKSPGLMLRNTMIMKKQGKERLTFTAKYAYMVYAWNAHRKGRPLSRLLVRYDEEGKVNLPAIEV